MKNFLKDKYEVKNKDKYRGDPDKVIYRSSYEKRVFEWCDRSPSVLEWSSENIVVPYFDPVKNKKRRYVVDLWMKYKNKKGEIKTELIEIKPMSQVQKPVKGRKKDSTYINEVLTHTTNVSKWDAAEKFSKERGWGFRILTEESIFL